MSELEKKVVEDGNVESLFYNDSEHSVTILYKGGSKWKYTPIVIEDFIACINKITVRSILEEVKHNNIVGVRVR
jgi:hypothetical protein